MDKSAIMLKRVIKTFALILVGIAFGYWWAFQVYGG